MKNNNLINVLFLAAIILALFTVGCSEKKNKSIESQPLVVERQYAKIEGCSEWDYLEFAIDVPIKGPQPLLDSIKWFLINELYQALPDDIADPFPYKAEEVNPYDMAHLLSSFTDKYSNKIKNDLDGFCSINLFLIAQTESFVTYGYECYHGSGSTGSALFLHTFSKTDGRRIENIISWNDVKRFIKRHPNSDQPFDQSQLESKDIEDFNHFYDAGLTEEGLLLVNEMTGNHYGTVTLKYKEVLPYISTEARNLVKSMGDSSSYCFAGERIGVLKASDGTTIILTETPGKLGWIDDGLSINNIWEAEQNAKLQAFYVTKEGYTPANIFDGMSESRAHWDDFYSSNPEQRVFAFDASKNNLYLPLPENVMMGKHDCCDRYEVWHFNGQEFVKKGEDGGYWLHPSLRKFGRLCYEGISENYLVRIDEMRIYDDRYDDQYEAAKIDTCRYRYAAWTNNKSMLDAPDLVIENGYWDPAGECFVFENNGYRYAVMCSMGALNVFYKGKTILDERMHDISLYQ